MGKHMTDEDVNMWDFGVVGKSKSVRFPTQRRFLRAFHVTTRALSLSVQEGNRLSMVPTSFLGAVPSIASLARLAHHGNKRRAQRPSGLSSRQSE